MQDDGKYASKPHAKPSGGHCAVLPYIFVTAAEADSARFPQKMYKKIKNSKKKGSGKKCQQKKLLKRNPKDFWK